MAEAANAFVAGSLSGFVLNVPKEMAGAIWDGLMRSRAGDQTMASLGGPIALALARKESHAR
jgi:hypothetical protein